MFVTLVLATVVGLADPSEPHGEATPSSPQLEASAASPTNTVRVLTSTKDARRARPMRERRLSGEIPGLVTYDFGKTASGERTHLYRIMGQGGAVLDVTDYGAQAVRAYSPGKTGALTEILHGPDDVIGYEKAGNLQKVWKMTPIRRPQMTGLVFILDEGTNGVAKIVHTLDAKNHWTTETTRGTNATEKVERRL